MARASRTRWATRSPLGELLAQARETSPGTPARREADDEWLEAHDVAYWAGPRSLPLWLPRDMPGFWTRSNAAYRCRRAAPRSARRWSARSPTSASGASTATPRGLSRADELALLAPSLTAR